MRSPVVAFSLLAAAAVSPALVSGAPTSPKFENATEAPIKTHQIRGTAGIAATLGAALGSMVQVPLGPNASNASNSTSQANQNDPVSRTAAMKKAKAQAQPAAPKLKAATLKGKRAGGNGTAGDTAGGNAALPQIPAGVHRRAGNAGSTGGNCNIYSGAISDVSGGSAINAADEQGTDTNNGGNTACGAGGTISAGYPIGGFIYNSGGAIDNMAESNTAGGGDIIDTGKLPRRY